MKNNGQAMILVLFVMVIGILVTTGATYTLLSSLQSTTLTEVGSLSQITAESGLENAILQLLRNPSYSGETMDLGSGQSVRVTVITGTPIMVTSVSTVGNSVQRMQATVQYENDALTILSWSQLP